MAYATFSREFLCLEKKKETNRSKKTNQTKNKTKQNKNPKPKKKTLQTLTFHLIQESQCSKCL